MTGRFPGAMLCSCCRALAITLSPTATHGRGLQFSHFGGFNLPRPRVLYQGCVNPGFQVAVLTELCTVTPKIFGFSEWNLFRVTLQGPAILWVAPRFLENFHNTALYDILYTVHVRFEAFYSRTCFSLSLYHLRLGMFIG